MLLVNATIYDKDFIPRPYDMKVEDGKITELGPRGSVKASEGEKILDLTGKTITPGMLDNHIHGAMGKDVMDGEFESLDTISRYLASKGVTSFLPTTMTMGVEDLKPVFEIQEKLSGANMLGYHMEGPFIAVEKKGAQNEKYVRKPTVEEMAIYGENANIKIITIAPEVEGALEFIEQMHDKVVISMGHSIADYDQAKAAIEAGAKSVTHCFNAMNHLLHRAPGIIGAAVQAGIYGELIADGLHIHPATVYCNYKMFGPERMILISDALRAAGLGDGDYEFGGQPMFVRDNVARVSDGAIAGGMSNTWNNMRNCYHWGIPLGDALRMGSLTPATLIGEDYRKGSLDIGKDADFVITNDALDVLDVYIGGKKFE
jgi:N-acetylglucosamine-6-phosphate deacetylase